MKRTRKVINGDVVARKRSEKIATATHSERLLFVFREALATCCGAAEVR